MTTALGLLAIAFVVIFTAHAARSGRDPRRAIAEAWVNILIGFSVNYIANLIILPLAGAHISAASNWWMGWLYTVVSIVRQYAIRRWFQTRLERLVDAISSRGAE